MPSSSSANTSADAYDDPFDAVLRPPPNETEEEKSIRLAQETESLRVSQAIDDSIQQERLKHKKRKLVRVLLLGQSESGKSTVLRQFQRLYTPTAFREERAVWRSVIQLNLVRSIRTILDAVDHTLRHRAARVDSGDDSDSDMGDSLGSLNDIQAIAGRLAPVRIIEASLITKLVPRDEDEPTRLTAEEVFVRPGAGWKGHISASKINKGKAPSMRSMSTRPGSPGSSTVVGGQSDEEIMMGLHACRLDMLALWNHSSTKEILRRKKIRLEESPGFFLNDIERIASMNFSPNDDDVLRARLKTVGVSETSFEMEAPAGREAGTEWRIIDVGGSRSQRATWMPFFDAVDAIIFMAPISGFDQVLVEDKTINRLEDSVLIWKDVCSNKLLANVELVLFLNKCDILERKLNAGVRLAKYVRSYGDRPNNLDDASKYFRSKFNAIQREYSPSARKFYGFCTSVTDTTTTSGILASVRDMVVRQHLQRAKLM